MWTERHSAVYRLTENEKSHRERGVATLDRRPAEGVVVWRVPPRECEDVLNFFRLKVVSRGTLGDDKHFPLCLLRRVVCRVGATALWDLTASELRLWHLTKSAHHSRDIIDLPPLGLHAKEIQDTDISLECTFDEKRILLSLSRYFEVILPLAVVALVLDYTGDRPIVAPAASWEVRHHYKKQICRVGCKEIAGVSSPLLLVPEWELRLSAVMRANYLHKIAFALVSPEEPLDFVIDHTIVADLVAHNGWAVCHRESGDLSVLDKLDAGDNLCSEPVYTITYGSNLLASGVREEAIGLDITRSSPLLRITSSLPDLRLVLIIMGLGVYRYDGGLVSVGSGRGNRVLGVGECSDS
jgi:hypothetical protein